MHALQAQTILILGKSPGGGVLPYMGYIGMCGPKGYGFSALLVINRVSIFAFLVDSLKCLPLMLDKASNKSSSPNDVRVRS